MFESAQPHVTHNSDNIRELKKTTMTTATRTSANKRFNEYNNGSARAL